MCYIFIHPDGRNHIINYINDWIYCEYNIMRHKVNIGRHDIDSQG